MGNIKRPYYKHYILEIKCNFEEANSIGWLENKTDSFLDILGINKLKTVYHQFQPQGISLVHILSSSHIAIHSWPENQYVQVDFISCQEDINLQKLTLAIDNIFQGYEHKVLELNY
jgi:S-adenosylmethionine/arginine decarboxylase-like enzyme